MSTTRTTNASTYEWALERIRALEQLIAESAPLAWVASQDTDSAVAWEKKAEQLLKETP